MQATTVSRSPQSREVLVFGGGVVVYPPVGVGGYWRVRWVEGGRRRERSATCREVAVARASGVVERLGLGVPSDLGSASGAALVAHYLAPGRRPARGRRWSARHREEQESYCRRFVVPVIGPVAVSGLTRAHFQRIVDGAATASVAEHLRRCLSALVAAGLEEGLLLARQDVLRGVHWSGPATAGAGSGFFDDDDDDDDEGGRLVEAALIPTGAAVEALADAAGDISGVWWRQLQILVVAYSGMRWGEMVALTADRVDPDRRRIVVDRQVIETRHGLAVTKPKNRRRRMTMYPARTPHGMDLAGLVQRRLAEVEPDGLVFPSPRGLWARRSNYRRNLFAPAARAANWPLGPDGRSVWTFHSLRHVFATWALSQPGARIEDVSALLGHSTVRVTQDLYIAPDGDLYTRFYTATA